MSKADDELESLVAAMGNVSPAGREILRQRDRLVRLERLLDSGLILLGPQGAVRLANERAREMLEVGDGEWSDVAALLHELIEAARTEEESWEVEVELAGRRLQATVTSCEDGASRLVELRDGRALAGVEADLMVAARVKNLTRLFVGLTHDLKAPLNAITLHLELLRRTVEQSPEAAAGGETLDPVKRIGVVETELRRLQRSLEVFLEQAVPTDMEPRSFDLREAVSELGDLLQAPAHQDGKEVEVELPGREAKVETRRDHVKQALLNVAINGLDAMTDGGLLRLRLARAGDRVKVEITDTGPGIDADVRDRLFDIYVTGKESGFGAGLYCARSLLESEGGTLELTSTSASGTTFTAELPLARTD